MAARTWDGTVHRAGLSGWAGKAREDLAAAAGRYDWLTVFDLVRQHPHFVNSCRPDGRAWFAPLHQAAYGGAPREIAARLIAAGAWRGLRSAAGERPVDVAKRRGHDHLVEILEPPRRRPVDPSDLDAVEFRFHGLIRLRMSEFRVRHELRLPELEVLLELDEPELFFPVPGMHGGFLYRLEAYATGLSLLSSSWSRIIGGSEERHEITPAEIRLV